MPRPHLALRTVPITPLQVFWSAWAVAGLCVVGWASLHVAGTAAFLTELRQGWGFLTVALDLVFLGIPVVAFAVIESRRLGMRWPWIWIPLAIPLPGAFLIPLFFLLRERALLRAQVLRIS
jgi:hypothetical protein